MWHLDLKTKEIWSNPSISIRTVTDRIYEKFYSSIEKATEVYERIIRLMAK